MYLEIFHEKNGNVYLGDFYLDEFVDFLENNPCGVVWILLYQALE